MQKLLILVAFILFPVVCNVAGADEALERGIPSVEKTARIDALFQELKFSTNEQDAFQIEQKIWIEWTSPDDPELAKLMQQALSARRASDFDKALRILDRVVANWSAYAEGWNQRATVHFLRGDWEKSLTDIAETLYREPRHFGSLAGRGVIHLQQGRLDLAVQSILTAMHHHPYLRERNLIAHLIEEAK
ncbi:MAG: tetratricopeptide repeat protein [Magnetovibrio sp.]|nr:tetratricopeptide repeat protein [Magnetovibrio sp.]